MTGPTAALINICGAVVACIAERTGARIVCHDICASCTVHAWIGCTFVDVRFTATVFVSWLALACIRIH